MREPSRRDLIKLAAVGGVVFASRLAGARRRGAERDFYFLQLSDLHWGYAGPANPEAEATLPEAIAAIASLEAQPAFVVLTGDLTHTTDDAALRRKRMAEVRALLARLPVKQLHLLPGEHDAALDAGAAFRETFGETRWAFDHQGIRFVGLDNVSDPSGALGEAQIDWLARQLAPLPRDQPAVVFAHRPLFDLAPSWDWATRDGAKAIDLLERRGNVTVFYGHIHQEHHHSTGRVQHHAARSLIFPLPPPEAAKPGAKKAPLPWDPAHPRAGLGWRRIEEKRGAPSLIERGARGEGA